MKGADGWPARRAFRLALCRRIATFVGIPRRCRESICRRSKRCMGPTMRCHQDFPPPKVSPEREDLARAMVYRAVKERLAEIEAKRDDSAAE